VIRAMLRPLATHQIERDARAIALPDQPRDQALASAPVPSAWSGSTPPRCRRPSVPAENRVDHHRLDLARHLRFGNGKAVVQMLSEGRGWHGVAELEGARGQPLVVQVLCRNWSCNYCPGRTGRTGDGHHARHGGSRYQQPPCPSSDSWSQAARRSPHPVPVRALASPAVWGNFVSELEAGDGTKRRVQEPGLEEARNFLHFASWILPL
jgi:hypothetical protein